MHDTEVVVLVDLMPHVRQKSFQEILKGLSGFPGSCTFSRNYACTCQIGSKEMRTVSSTANIGFALHSVLGGV